MGGILVMNIRFILVIGLFFTFISWAHSNDEVNDLIESSLEFKAQGDIDNALDKLKSALEIDSNNVRARTHLGTTLMEKDLFEEAILELNKAIKLDAEMPLAHYALAVCYARKKHPNVLLARKHVKMAQEYGYNVVPWFLNYLDRLERGDINPDGTIKTNNEKKEK